MSECVHHWMIDSQGIGRCKKCPAVKDFVKLQRKELHQHNGGASARRGRPRKSELKEELL